MFREIILPIFRNTRLCVTACGIMHQRCCRPPAGNIAKHLETSHCGPWQFQSISAALPPPCGRGNTFNRVQSISALSIILENWLVY